MPSAKAEELAAKIKDMTPANQLRLVAEMLDTMRQVEPSKRKALAETAKSIVERVSTELGALLMFDNWQTDAEASE